MRKFYYDTEFIETPGRIQLISIGIVSDDGRELYLVNSEYDSTVACKWVRDNVFPYISGEKELRVWEIAERILDFIRPSKDDPVELWAYYGAYDHVVLCQIFGIMAELPEGMPMMTNDIKWLHKNKGHPALPPKPINAHHALADARWVRDAYNVLEKFSFINY